MGQTLAPIMAIWEVVFTLFLRSGSLINESLSHVSDPLQSISFLSINIPSHSMSFKTRRSISLQSLQVCDYSLSTLYRVAFWIQSLKCFWGFFSLNFFVSLLPAGNKYEIENFMSQISMKNVTFTFKIEKFQFGLYVSPTCCYCTGIPLARSTQHNTWDSSEVEIQSVVGAKGGAV